MPLSEEAKKARREYMKKWREENKQHVQEYNKKYREENKEKLKAAQDRYWAKQYQMAAENS